PWGPYEGDPCNPIITSQPKVSDERSDVDHLKPHYYNPDSYLQKSGHGSLVETPAGDPYVFHLTSRPFTPELRCTLGRETAMQKMVWNEDGWLRMADGSNFAKAEVEAPALAEAPVKALPEHDDFDSEELGVQYYSPRIMPSRFADLKARPGWIRLRGQESQASQNKVSLLARKLTSTNLEITTKMNFTPEIHHHYAGLTLYYDNMNNILLRKYYSETLGGNALSLVRIDNGVKVEIEGTRVPAPEGPVYFRLTVKDRVTRFFWSSDGSDWEAIGPSIDTSEFSDEYCEFGEFTGTMAGIINCDLIRRQHPADFDFFEYRDL
ncbi:MAG: family 43 glycosylhydrolase, partial [Spirochaetales bacterium]|nr:family 43 glycosylhydrolase [Spirochaetales bacterium]